MKISTYIRARKFDVELGKLLVINEVLWSLTLRSNRRTEERNEFFECFCSSFEEKAPGFILTILSALVLMVV